MRKFGLFVEEAVCEEIMEGEDIWALKPWPPPPYGTRERNTEAWGGGVPKGKNVRDLHGEMEVESVRVGR